MPSTQPEERRRKHTRETKITYAFFGVAFLGVAFFAAAFFGAAFFAAFLADCGAVVLVTRPDLVLPRVTAGLVSTAGAWGKVN
jgi:hypothetical protein